MLHAGYALQTGQKGTNKKVETYKVQYTDLKT